MLFINFIIIIITAILGIYMKYRSFQKRNLFSHILSTFTFLLCSIMILFTYVQYQYVYDYYNYLKLQITNIYTLLNLLLVALFIMLCFELLVYIFFSIYHSIKAKDTTKK